MSSSFSLLRDYFTKLYSLSFIVTRMHLPSWNCTKKKLGRTLSKIKLLRPRMNMDRFLWLGAYFRQRLRYVVGDPIGLFLHSTGYRFRPGYLDLYGQFIG
ncbi:hypothetical protein BDQ17DRAFT_334379 [Cyathus striatus]|nr:hypothetical protein BDQ17DRAFT_334379 [Cyathus striatus]